MFQELVSELLKDGYNVSFNAPGHSMYPTIMANEPVLVAPIEPSAVHKGDIVLYRSNGHLIAHRVMGIVSEDKANEFASLLDAFSHDDDYIYNGTNQKLDTGSGSPDKTPDGASLFFILRGDASLTYDEPVKSEQVLGKVISIERNGSSVNPYSIKHKFACWLFGLPSRLKMFLGLSATSQ